MRRKKFRCCFYTLQSNFNKLLISKMMDPVSMIFAIAMKNPQATADLAKDYAQPGQVDVQQLKSSVADFAMQTLTCYHKTARFRGVQILGSPWRQQSMYGAQSSVVIRIHFTGVSGTPYQMIVAAMAKENAFRTFVLEENALVPYNKHCELENWASVTG